MRWGVLLAIVLAMSCGRHGFDVIGSDADASGDGGGDTGIGTQPLTSNLVFVTSTVHVPGTLGGLAGADAVCNARAAAADLPGTYVAYLSSSSIDAPSRLAGSRGWQRPDGRPVADTTAQLIAGDMWYLPALDELGAVVPSDPRVLTATDSLGNRSNSCADYTIESLDVYTGTATSSDEWSYSHLDRCSRPARLYCFGVGGTTPVQVDPPAGRLAFLSTQFTPTQGGTRADADAACQTEASTAGLPGTYLAMLADTSSSGISRFDESGPTWYRLDGVALATSAQQFADGVVLAPLNLYIDGSRALLNFVEGVAVWTGATDPRSVGTDASTCVDWSRDTNMYTGAAGDPTSMATPFFVGSPAACTWSWPLYCLQG